MTEAVRIGLAGRWFMPSIVAVLVGQAVTCAFLLSQSYFFAEDFTFLQLFGDATPDRDLLGRSIFGHLIPGFILINKYIGAWFGASWLLTSLLTVAVQLGGTVAFTRLLLALCGRRWWLPVIVAAFGLSIVYLNTAHWWGATATIQVALALSVSVWGCVARYAAHRQGRHLLSLVLMYTLALLFWEKSLAMCAYVGLFSLMVGLSRDRLDEQRTWAERFRATLSLWPAWALLAGVSLIDLAIYVRGPYLEEAGAPAGARDTALFLVRNVTEGLAPSLVGHVYPANAGPTGTVLSWALPTAAIVALAGWTSWRSGLARRTWAWFIVADVFSQLLVARGRVGIMGVDTAAHELRYQLDATVLFLVAVAVSVPAAVAAAPLAAQARRRLTAGVLVAPLAVLPLWVASLGTIMERSPGDDSRVYFEALRTSEYPPGTEFLDLPVPAWIIPPGMFPWNMLQSVTPPVDPNATFTTDPTGASSVGINGEVKRLELVPLPNDSPAVGRTCLTPGEQKRVVAPLHPLPPAGTTVVVRFTYSSDARAVGNVFLRAGEWAGHVGGIPKDVVFKPGRGAYAAYVLPPAGWSGVDVLLRDGTHLCVTDVTYMTPVP